MDVLIPPDIPVAEIEWRILDNTAVSTSPLNGVTTTFTRPGTRWGARLSFRNLKDRDRARLLAILAAVRGRSGRIYFTSAADPARTGGYSFPELFTNADFSNGTTGWSGSVGATAGVTLAVRDRVMRSTRTGTSANSFALRSASVSAVTAYTPYAARFFTLRGRGNYTSGWSIYDNVIGARMLPVTTQYGLLGGATVPLGTTLDPCLFDESTTTLAGDYVEVPFVSLARCALVDNGGNYMLQSDAAQTTWSASNLTVSANAHTAPDGTSTADGLIEDSSTGFHYLQQSYTRVSVAEDWCVYADAATIASSRNVALDLADGAGNSATSVFNLTAGTAGTPSVTGSVTNARAFIVNMGNGYYRCYLIARLPATTTTRMQVLMASGSTLNYAGNGSGRVAVRRMGAHRTGVPSRPTATTAAVVGPASQTGSGLYLKGLPASTQNIRAAGDMVEIVLPTYSQLVRLTAALDSDAAGLGYLQFENPVRTSPADNAAVIFNQPMMRGILSEGPAWPTRPGLFSDFDLDLIEDIAP